MTLLGRGAYELLDVTPGTGTPSSMPGLAGTLFEYELQWIQFRLHVADGPHVSVWIQAGFCQSIPDNLFGADLLDYFTVALTRDDVTFMAE